jgi:hypothetical protein
MSVDRNQMAGGYERQMSAVEIPATRQVWLGEDTIVGWAGRVYFPTRYAVKLLTNRGQEIGARGELTEWEIPSRPPRTTTFTISDYDQVLIDQLTDWQASGLALRLFVNGMLWLRCRVKQINRKAPLTQDMQLITLNRQLYVYKNNLGYSVWDGVDTAATTYNNPFLSNETYGHLYGQVS